MDANENNQNKNLMIALVLTGLVLVGWQYLFPQPLPKNTVKKADQAIVSNEDKNNQTSGEIVPVDLENTSTQSEEGEVFVLKNSAAKVTLSNLMVIKEYEYKNTDKVMSEVFPKLGNKLTFLVGGKRFDKPLNFKQTSEKSIQFSSQDLEGTIKLNKKGQLIVNANSQKGLQFINSISSKEESKDQKVNNFVYYTDELTTEPVEEDAFEEKDLKVGWFGIDYNYHVLAFVVPSTSYHIKGENSQLKVANLKPSNNVEIKISFLKKNYDDLVGLGDNLKNAVDFGIWSVIALPMLRGLQLFYSYLQNWGLAIIFLTILIRLAMFPLQHSSFKSMKKMQVLQPELKKIKERYKDDQRKQQEETMALFKKHGANPVGGCLPLFLQMPIFFAFYRMLYNSVELVDAPFFWWIQDLSERDPFYILPALVGGAMYFSMQLNPQTSMDPAQQKVMKFMPIMFSAFLFTLPAGLNLYIFVSTIVGMAQQIFVYKRTPATAKA